MSHSFSVWPTFHGKFAAAGRQIGRWTRSRISAISVATTWVAFAFAALSVLTSGVLPARADAAGPGSKDRLQLFLLIGQSNMCGRGTVDATDRIPVAGVWMLDERLAWVPAVDPMHTGHAAGVGPGRAFGLALKSLNPALEIGLIPAAVGGTSLAQWHPGGDLYSNAVSRARFAMKSGRLRGILWHQGESDATIRADALTYGTRWEDFIRNLRHDLGAPDVPVVVGELCRSLYRRTDHKLDFAREVNEQLALLPLQVGCCGFVSSVGLVDRGDLAHFNATSQRELGRRYALAYFALDPSWAPLRMP